jgi:hypothetical protein
MTEQSIFYYVDDNSRIIFENAYQAISLTEMWDYMKKDRESFMFSSDKEIEIISKKMEDLGYDGHSGSSFGITMRNMQFIALNGLEEHKKIWLNNK